MLVLSRKIEEGMRIGDTIEVKVLDVFSTDSSGSKKAKAASIGIQAPRDVRILRKELVEAGQENRAAEESARLVKTSELAALLREKTKK